MSPRLAVLILSALLALTPAPLRADEPATEDAHAEMTAALEQQADTLPAPPVLLTAPVEPALRESPPGRQASRSQGSTGRAAQTRSASETRRMSSGSAEASRSAAADARQSRSAADSAAGQAASQRAKDRAAQHPHPEHP